MGSVKCKNCASYQNEWCKEVADSPDPEMVRDCVLFRAQTNADRIRAMSDEELAEWIVGLLDDCTQCAGCDRSLCWKEPCMKWLQQPAEE